VAVLVEKKDGLGVLVFLNGLEALGLVVELVDGAKDEEGRDVGLILNDFCPGSLLRTRSAFSAVGLIPRRLLGREG
jgi:hypothetical protein